ncbi:hypothetical protein CSIRO_3084 [Bradyrhizobiaceae bacterium SG-6C]|nr:hypothetical protein CSIRO_3084 [Bradyrhizobiaceae bacterium SG-6C]
MSEPSKIHIKLWGLSVSAEGVVAVVAAVVIVFALFGYLLVK